MENMDSTVKDIIDDLAIKLGVTEVVKPLLAEYVERAFIRGFNIGAFGGLDEEHNNGC